MVSIIIGKKGLIISATFAKRLHCFPINIAACGIGGTVRSIGSNADQADIFESVQKRGCRESQLLITPACSIAPHVNDGFSACEESYLLTGVRMIRQQFSKHPPSSAGFLAERIRYQDRLIAPLTARIGGCLTQQCHGPNNFHLHIGHTLGRFLFDAGPGGIRKVQIVLLYNSYGIFARSRICHSGA